MTSVPARAATPASLSFSLPDGGVLTCLLRRSARARRLRLTVSAVGELALVLPQRQRLTTAQARDILDAHAEWIRRALERVRTRIAVSRPPLELPDRVTLPALGMDRRVAVRPMEENNRVCGAFARGSGRAAATVRVRDDGAGIAPAELAALEGRLSRARTARSATGAFGEEHGLGLVLVDRIARVHGGSLILDGAPDQGFTVELHLPLA